MRRGFISERNACTSTSIKSAQPGKMCFFKDERGTSLIEFAILGPVFIILILGTLNLGIMITVQNALESAAREASRYGMMGQSESGLTRSQSILQVIQQVSSDYSGGIIDPGKLQVTVEAYPDLIEEGSGQVVLYKLSYPWDTFFNLFGGSNIVTLHAQTPVVNEAFPTTL